MEFNQEGKFEVFSQQITCKHTLPSLIKLEDTIKVNINKFSKQEGGIFEQSYFSFIVETPKFNCHVERRYSDFEWLKKYLEYQLPGFPVPAISKKGQFRRSDDKHLKKRMMILEKFMNKLLEVPELKIKKIV